MIISPEVYRIKKSGNGTQGYISLSAGVKKQLGLTEREITLLILEKGEMPSEEDIQKAIENLGKLREAEDMLKKIKGEMGLK